MVNYFVIWKKSIFVRMIFTFLLTMLPIYLVGIICLNNGINALRQEVLNSMQSKVSFYLNNMETDIQRIKKLQYECITDDDLNQLASIPESLDIIEKTQAILRLQQRLQAIQNSSLYISEASVQIPALGKKITADDVFDEINKDEINALNVLPVSSGSQIIYWKDHLFLSALYPISNLYYNKLPMFIIQIKLSNDEIGKRLSQFSNYNEGGSLLMNTLSNYKVATNKNIAVNSEICKIVTGKTKVEQNGSFSFEMADKQYLALYTTSKYLNMVFTSFIPEKEVFKSIKKYQQGLYIFYFIALIIIIFFSFSTYNFIHQPILKMVNAFKKVENGELDISIGYKRDDEFSYLFCRFNAMVEYLKRLIEQVYKQKILVQKAELKQLQSQINPHFLYNSYFLLHRMIKREDYKNAVKYSKEMGTYFQFITRNSADVVPLSREVEHARIYANIQAVRFEGRIRVDFEALPEYLINFMVPRLILQPIIENAFEHGLEDKIEDGLLLVRFERLVDRICISVEDNGRSMGEEELENLKNCVYGDDNIKESTGIINIHRRIKLMFGNKSGLEVEKSKIGGLRINIILKEMGEGNV